MAASLLEAAAVGAVVTPSATKVARAQAAEVASLLEAGAACAVAKQPALEQAGGG